MQCRAFYPFFPSCLCFKYLCSALWNTKKNVSSDQKHAGSEKVKAEAVMSSSQSFKSQLSPFALQSCFKHTNSYKHSTDLLRCIALFNQVSPIEKLVYFLKSIGKGVRSKKLVRTE